MATGILLDFGRFYWNIDANVGIGCPNKAEDVHLVQLAFHCRANNPKLSANKEEQAIFSAVIPGAPYSGSPMDPLSIAIKFAQKQRGGVQDGRVSKMKPEGMYSPGVTWMLVGLNNNMVDILGGMWPFLDRHPKCTPALKELVKRTFHVTTNNN
jgi:hypothetical protein